MNLKEMREKRTRLITEAHGIVQAEAVTKEDRDKFDRIMADVETLEGDIARVERAEKLEAESRKTTRPPQPPPGSVQTENDERDEAEYRAFETYMRYGKDELTSEQRTLLRECRNLNPYIAREAPGYAIPRALIRRATERRDITTTGASGNVNGGGLIPQLFLPTLIDAQKLIGNTVSLVGKKVTNNNGAPIKVSMSNDTGNSLTTLTAETTVVAEQDPAFSGFILSTDTVATLVKISIQELEDSYFDLDTWIRTKFGMRYYRGLEYLITNGNGSNVAALPAGATLGATAAAASGPVYDDFVGCYGAQDPAYIPTSNWVMSSVTRAFIMGQKDNYGRPLFIPSPNSGTLDQILGRPITLNQALPSAVNTSSTLTVTGVLFGDFEQGYLLRTDGDLSIRRLDERYMDGLEVGFLAYARLGGASTDAGTHPIRTLVTPIT